ncbi:hypothetical protein [Pseudorhizobium pelagicum]|uniref:Transmembrane protein n=1 Tax=Pseudorhizobium pelagicum TaxID=1509405 RepID=A0A922NYP3_9HYPH|nr:hypothetical protein [Pseudorhizobium pelagicum]KEQ08276.1 hypothetical protein GV68_03000 [Pseudorhizobium pelagicum]KEQ09117.1 hypothetical protein GV67_00045 [Pseudorhizobium pelagicum]
MSRLVVPASASNARFAGNSVKDTPPDKFKERLIKYIPAESVAFYTFADKLLVSHHNLAGVPPQGGWPPIAVGLAWAFLLLGILGTPVYLRRGAAVGQPWKLHAAISTVAFILWAYTLSGSIFLIYQIYDVFYAALLAPVFTFVAGLVEPKAE